MKKENIEREEKAEKRFRDVQKKFQDGEKRIKDGEKRIKDWEKRIEHLENENNILTNEISKTKAKLEEVTKTLGFIQLRDKAKNFLKSFNIKLDKKDKEAIDPKKKTKWKK